MPTNSILDNSLFALSLDRRQEHNTSKDDRSHPKLPDIERVTNTDQFWPWQPWQGMVRQHCTPTKAGWPMAN